MPYPRAILIAVAIAAAAPAAAADAAWNHSGNGAHYAKAVSMPSGNTPTVSVSNRSVTVSWAASTMPGGGASITVTVPAGTANGSHTVYAVGSSGDVASAAITVSVTYSTTTPAWDV